MSESILDLLSEREAAHFMNAATNEKLNHQQRSRFLFYRTGGRQLELNKQRREREARNEAACDK